MLLNRFTQVGIQYLSLVTLKMRTHTVSVITMDQNCQKKGTHTHKHAHCRREIFASLGTYGCTSK